MGKKSKACNLGRSLIRDRFGHGNRKTVGNDSMLHVTEVQDGYDWGRLNLQSVTEESSFQEFLRTAELAGTEFQAEKLNIAFVNPKSNVGILSPDERQATEKLHTERKSLLKIPRRPTWTEKTTPVELEQLENFNFLEWRRELALLQQNESLIMTPYEKNLQFWRQLWRVVERSDVVVQIVDARNPLLFRSEDLERYVKEVNADKMNVILVNKADFLTDTQRLHWADYFRSLDVLVAFYSATLAAEAIKLEKSVLDDVAEADEMAKNDVEHDFEQATGHKLDEAAQSETDATPTTANEAEAPETLETDSRTKILSRTELIEYFKQLYTGPRYTPDVVTIGLVGYPNVGKSSTINTLMIDKKVSVSTTPGKTKHFQTLFVDTELMLCDSPGLVMPSFVLTKADMVLNGILPIDQLRDFVPPTNILCTHIPRHVLEEKYGVMIAKPPEGEDPNRPPYAEELLLAYGYNRGFMTANGQPDQSRSVRYVLKDYVAGRLLYCHAPPTMDQEKFHTFPERVRPEIVEASLPKQQQRAMRINRHDTTGDVDKKFFVTNTMSAHIQGRSNFPHIRQIASDSSASSSVGSSTMAQDKPWRHQKKEKREKLRRKFAHLDQH